jgi:hypothetical protein
MSNRIVLLTLLGVLGSTALAAASGPAPAKPLEVSTVGTTPAAVTDADRAKLAEVGRRHAADRAKPAVWRVPVFVSDVKKPDAATQVPSAGVRDRRKPAAEKSATGGRP